MSGICGRCSAQDHEILVLQIMAIGLIGPERILVEFWRRCKSPDTPIRTGRDLGAIDFPRRVPRTGSVAEDVKLRKSSSKCVGVMCGSSRGSVIGRYVCKK